MKYLSDRSIVFDTAFSFAEKLFSKHENNDLLVELSGVNIEDYIHGVNGRSRFKEQFNKNIVFQSTLYNYKNFLLCRFGKDCIKLLCENFDIQYDDGSIYDDDYYSYLLITFAKAIVLLN